MSDKGLVEAALFVAGEGITPAELAKHTGLEVQAIAGIVEQLQREYAQRDCGLEITGSEKGYLMRVKPEFEDRIVHLIPEADLPKSLLKTLALIAYEQPIKQTTIVKLRGNRVYVYLHRLEELGFIHGKPDGRTRLLSTTPKFKEYFQIRDLPEGISVQSSLLEPQQTILEIPEEEKTAIKEAKEQESNQDGNGQ